MPPPHLRLDRLSLAQLTVSNATSIEVVLAAAAAGFGAVGLRLEARFEAERFPVEPAAVPAELAAIRAECRASGIAVSNVTGRYLVPATTTADLARLVDAAAVLEADFVVAVSADPDAARAGDNLAHLGALAREAGMRVALEFITYNRVDTLDAALAMAAATGDLAVGLMVDALHFDRSGAAPDDLRAALDRLFIFQLCDAAGPRPATREGRIAESRTARLHPGEGDLPLAELVDLLPEDVVLELEAPHPDHLDLAAVARARLAADTTRRFLDTCAARQRDGAGAPP